MVCCCLSLRSLKSLEMIKIQRDKSDIRRLLQRIFLLRANTMLSVFFVFAHPFNVQGVDDYFFLQL